MQLPFYCTHVELELILFGAAKTCCIPHITSFSNSSLTTKPIMPRQVQLGGLSQQMHVRYTAHHKLALLASAKHMQEEEGVSLCAVVQWLKVAHAHSLIVK